MSRIPLFLFFIPILNGCLSFATLPSKEQLANFGRAYIVHVEDIPLGVDPNFNYVIRGGGSLAATQTIGIINTISVVTQLPEALKRAKIISKSLQEELSMKEVWMPTAKLAGIAAQKIGITGIPVTVAEKPLLLPGFRNEDYNAALRSWYNDNGPITNYRDLSLDKLPYVLEIAVGNGIFSKDLMLEVRVKLIDPSSGKVLGRTRKWEVVDLPDLDQAFSDNGRVFKDIFVSTGQKLIQQSLVDLRLINDE